GRLRRPLRENPNVQLPARPHDRSPHRLLGPQPAVPARRQSSRSHRIAPHAFPGGSSPKRVVTARKRKKVLASGSHRMLFRIHALTSPSGGMTSRSHGMTFGSHGTTFGSHGMASGGEFVS